MTGVKVKGLRNLKTAITKRVHNKPPQSGTSHLNMYLLSKEKQRLEQELAYLSERREIILGRIGEIREALIKLKAVAQWEEEVGMADGVGIEARAIPSEPPQEQAPNQWKTMTIEY